MMKGIGKKYRHWLGKLRLNTVGAISVSDAANIWQVTPAQARIILARLVKQGWLMRVRRGLYLPIPIEIESLPVVIEDPWIVADKAFSPCYISGWSAAEYWGLTDQIFQTVIVVTGRRFNSKAQQIGNVTFILTLASKDAFFGLKGVWRDGVKVQVADPSRLIIDIFANPRLVGGIRFAADIFEEYCKSSDVDLARLIEYGDLLGNRTVFKRLGFIAERLCPAEIDFIKKCHKRLSRGYSHLDPANKGEISISKWKLWVSKGMADND